MRVTSEDVRHISMLARVAMSEEEVELLRDQMSDILTHFDVLSQVDTEGVEPTGHSVDVETVMGDDRAEPSRDIEDVLANAPQREGDLIKVKAVLE